MAEVVFHIGVHEAMAFELQDQLYRARDLLRECDVLYPDETACAAHHWLPSAWLPLNEGLTCPDPEGRFRAMLGQLQDGQCLVLSSQEFWRAAPQSVNFAQLTAMVPAHIGRRAVVVMRDQASLIPALWHRIGQNRDAGLWGPQFDAALASGYFDGLCLDYSELFARLLAGFAPGDIQCLDYTELVAAKGGPGAFVLQSIGYSGAAAVAATMSAPAATAYHPCAQHVAQMVSTPARVDQSFVAACEALVMQHAPGSGSIGALSSREYDMLLARFVPSNRICRQMISGPVPDLNRVMVSQRPDHGRDALGSQFWLELCHWLDGVSDIAALARSCA